MLVMTEETGEAIRKIVEESKVGSNGGLRIVGSTDGDGDTAFEFEAAPEPAEGDEVVREGAAAVFLDQTAAELLADKTLDAHSHGNHFHFSLDEQEDAGYEIVQVSPECSSASRSPGPFSRCASAS